MENTNTVIGKDGYPFVVNSGGHNGHNDAFGLWAGIEATNRNGAQNLEATHDANVSGLNATNLASVAGINATNLTATATQKYVSDGTVSTTKSVTDGNVAVTKTVTDYGSMNAETTNRNATAVTKAVTDASLAANLDVARLHNEVLTVASELRHEIGTFGAAAALAESRTQFAILKDGAHTREEMQEAICELGKDTAKGFADAALEACKNTAAIQLEALRNKCDLEKQIAEICCCVEKDGNVTRTLVLAENTKRLEAELQEARMKAAIAGISNGKGDK